MQRSAADKSSEECSPPSRHCGSVSEATARSSAVEAERTDSPAFGDAEGTAKEGRTAARLRKQRRLKENPTEREDMSALLLLAGDIYANGTDSFSSKSRIKISFTYKKTEKLKNKSCSVKALAATRSHSRSARLSRGYLSCPVLILPDAQLKVWYQNFNSGQVESITFQLCPSRRLGHLRHFWDRFRRFVA